MSGQTVPEPATVHLLGMIVYGPKSGLKPASGGNFTYRQSINYTTQQMPATVSTIRNAGLDPATMNWGQYQVIPDLQRNWTDVEVAKWPAASAAARASLSGQQVTLGNGTVITKADLLDKVVRRCFNTTPPIAIKIDVTEKASTATDKDLHDVILEWGNDDDMEPQLNLTMVCPYNS